MKNKLEVLYEDNHIIVVVKPANLLTQGDNTHDLDLLTQVKEYIKKKYQKPGNVYLGLVHRLDRPVSGVMVFARTSKAASRLSEQVRNHSFEKKYFAVVHGKIKEKEKTLVDYLFKQEDGTTKIDRKLGKESILTYKLLEYQEEYDESLLEITLKTGRHHQIRVQLAHLGHPLCGDQRYGRIDHTQIALHAYSLSFFHPVTKERLCFEVLPKRTDYWSHFTLSKNVK